MDGAPIDDALNRSYLRSSISEGSTGHVLLSFPGDPNSARQSFPRRLHARLQQYDLTVHGPDERQVAIQQSQICIPILSEDYTSSERCLEELVQMMEGRRRAEQMVWPIFDRVQRSDIRNLTASFQIARGYANGGLQSALEEVSGLPAWRVADRREEELAKRVVLTVLVYFWPTIQTGPRFVRYNVFLSYRGKDTRCGFPGRLFISLREAGVSVYPHDISVRARREYRSELRMAISGSPIYILVLSRNYASSRWSIGLLARMLEFTEIRHLIVPIFYLEQPQGDGSQGPFYSYWAARIGDELQLKILGLPVDLLLGFFHPNDRSIGETISQAVQFVLTLLRDRFQLDVSESLPGIR
ncbi:uncharacterized protein LOC115727077 [Rhodamnia argentea]|uniref:ADP-ribosyl cyclase/cyclic ADP-ribose hydrolase n=1 Tax=Rhodamnia argentea TaxID=178133 RepID=A0A8B8MSN2_9MYRT|nr:uncharacterized protein LOC115727077 [Rhodamnia argentea]